MNNMSKQLESLFKDLSSNLKLENLENMDFENFESDGDEDIDDENAPEGISMGIPIGSIFANFVPKKQKDEEETNGGRQKVKVESKKAKKKKKYLDTFGTNLTQKAKNNELDMVIGRDKEIQRVIQILNRRTKNNPCLIGEPGVGKTAIAQGLAIKIANNNVPAKLLNKEVYLLDMTSVIAGTQFRGQFEARMKGIIDECKEFKNIILVIDEIHNIIGAGDGEHSMNAANILKPSLANGEIQLIGTTTLREYRKYIEKDTALERRFQQVLVEEPNIDDTISILTGIKKYYEEYHKVKISNDVIKQAVIMSEKYIHDRFLPDKAIDILDEACSRINLENKELFRLEMLKQELAKVQSEKEEVIAADSTEDYQKAADLKTRECQLIEEIDKLSAKAKPKQLNVQDIANVIESWTKIPVKKITEAETQKLLNLEDIENLDGAITFESQEQNPDSDEPSKISGAAIPLGSIFSNMFSNKASKSNSDESEELNDGRRKVKVEKKKNKKQNKKKKFLDTFGINLTDKAKNNELDIVIGREKEIQRIVQILNRRSKNNPCLIGEPGVGKTAIAQGLAIKIANQNVPAKLLNKEVYLLDMTAVIAGTQFRGQFESRMKGIIDECKEYGNIILVIDEIHNIIGAGDGEHSMNAANILKPALSNGEIQLIGTTTLKEYRKYIEKDSALERRFQQVLVEEPNIEDSIVILEGIKKYYEEYHKVKISSDIIRQAVIMSEKYIHDRFLPDKAIDILDSNCPLN